MQTYLVNLKFHDPGYAPPIKLRKGDVVELDDATANHINRKQNGTLSPYAEERALEAAPHDRMLRGESNRHAPDDREGGASDQGPITSRIFKAIVNKE